MVFGKLFGRSKQPAPPHEPPSAAGPARTGPSAAPPASAATIAPTETERQEYGYLREAVGRYGLAKLTTPGIGELMGTPLADERAQIRRVVDHPAFRTALHEMADHADAEEEQMRLLQNFMADMKDFGREGFVSPGLLSVIKDKSGSGRDYVVRVFAHPEALDTMRRYEAHREELERRHAAEMADGGFAAFMAEVEAEAFGDPNRMLTYTDTRPQNFEGLRLRHVAHYRRIAGTMSDRERFVYLMAHATKFYDGGLDEVTAQNEFALRMTCALYGGGRGDQEWELDRDYRGEKEDFLLKEAKRIYDPWPVDKYFNHGAKVVLDMHASHPHLPLAKWGMAKLRPHSAGWATSR